MYVCQDDCHCKSSHVFCRQCMVWAFALGFWLSLYVWSGNGTRGHQKFLSLPCMWWFHVILCNSVPLCKSLRQSCPAQSRNLSPHQCAFGSHAACLCWICVSALTHQHVMEVHWSGQASMYCFFPVRLGGIFLAFVL